MIQVENLSKLYRIGKREEQHNTLKSAFGSMLRRPINNLRNLRRLSQTNDDEDSILWALKNVSFDIAEGEVVGIIGSNGAGKSTLLKILSRVTYPTEGLITVNGRVGSLLEVGTGFHPELTGRENVYMNGTILGMTRREIDQRFDEIVEFAGVEKFIDTPIKRYSSGMQVRLAFGVAAHLEPEILIIDEVLSVGDAEFQRKSIGKMRDVAQDGRTVLFVSHNLSSIKNLCSRAIWLKDGMIKNDSSVDVVTNAYLQETLAKKDLIKNDMSIEINILDLNHNLLEIWNLNEEIIIQVKLQTNSDIKNAAVDISGYSVQTSARLLSLQSDMFPSSDKFNNDKKLIYEFHITNTGIATQELYIDVGIRSKSSGQYLAVFQQVDFISVSSSQRDIYSLAYAATHLPASLVISESRDT